MSQLSFRRQVRMLTQSIVNVLGAAGFISLSLKLRDSGKELEMRNALIGKLPSFETEAITTMEELEEDFFEYFNRDGWRQASTAKALAKTMVESYLAIVDLALTGKEENGSVYRMESHHDFLSSIESWIKEMDSLLGFHCQAQINAHLLPGKESKTDKCKQKDLSPEEKRIKTQRLFLDLFSHIEKSISGLSVRSEIPKTYELAKECTWGYLASSIYDIKCNAGADWVDIAPLFYKDGRQANPRTLTQEYSRSKPRTRIY